MIRLRRRMAGDIGAFVGRYTIPHVEMTARRDAATSTEPSHFINEMKSRAETECVNLELDWLEDDGRLANEWGDARQRIYDGYVEREDLETTLKEAQGEYSLHYQQLPPDRIPTLPDRFYWVLFVLLVLLELPVNFPAFQPLSLTDQTTAWGLAALSTAALVATSHISGLQLHEMHRRLARWSFGIAVTFALILIAAITYLRVQFIRNLTIDVGYELPDWVVTLFFLALNIIFFLAGMLLSHKVHEPRRHRLFAAIRAFTRSKGSYLAALKSIGAVHVERIQRWRDFAGKVDAVKEQYRHACSAYCRQYSQVDRKKAVPAEKDWPPVRYKAVASLKWPATRGDERSDEMAAFLTRFPDMADDAGFYSLASIGVLASAEPERGDPGYDGSGGGGPGGSTASAEVGFGVDVPSPTKSTTNGTSAGPHEADLSASGHGGTSPRTEDRQAGGTSPNVDRATVSDGGGEDHQADSGAIILRTGSESRSDPGADIAGEGGMQS